LAALKQAALKEHPMRRSSWIASALVFLASLACAGEPEKAHVELYGDYGSMYAGTTRVEVELQAYYWDDVRTLEPFVRLTFEPLEACSNGESCSTTSIDKSFDDVGPLLAALRNAQAQLAARTTYASPPMAPAPPCGPAIDSFANITVDAATHRMRYGLGDRAAEFDGDEVAWFIKMLEPADAMLKQLRPQVEAFNALAPAREKPRAVKPCGATPAQS
jgi:hypothetical protein